MPRWIGGRLLRRPVIGGVKAGISAERFLLDLLRHFLPRLEGAFVDVGANLGQTLCKVKVADPGRAYYGFEPNAACHAYLAELVRLNGWKAVTVFPFGLSDRAGVLELHLAGPRDTDGQGSFLPRGGANGTPRPASVRARPAVVLPYSEIRPHVGGPVGFVKIDVEGTELEVVRGMLDVLRQDAPVLAIELLPRASLAGRHEMTTRLLRSLGYSLFVVEKTPAKRWAGLREIGAHELPGDSPATDYLAIPARRTVLLDRLPEGIGLRRRSGA